MKIVLFQKINNSPFSLDVTYPKWWDHNQLYLLYYTILYRRWSKCLWLYRVDKVDSDLTAAWQQRSEGRPTNTLFCFNCIQYISSSIPCTTSISPSSSLYHFSPLSWTSPPSNLYPSFPPPSLSLSSSLFPSYSLSTPLPVSLPHPSNFSLSSSISFSLYPSP